MSVNDLFVPYDNTQTNWIPVPVETWNSMRNGGGGSDLTPNTIVLADSGGLLASSNPDHVSVLATKGVIANTDTFTIAPNNYEAGVFTIYDAGENVVFNINATSPDNASFLMNSNAVWIKTNTGSNQAFAVYRSDDSKLFNIATTSNVGYSLGNVSIGGIIINIDTAVQAINTTDLSNLSGTTSNIQAQIDNLQAQINIIDPTPVVLTPPGDALVVSSGNGFISSTGYGSPITVNQDTTFNQNLNGITPTQLGYLTTIGSNVQTQLDGKLNLTGGSLSGSLSVDDTLSVTATTGASVFLNGNNGHMCLEVLHSSDTVKTRFNTLDDGSGNITFTGSINTVTNAELGYVHGVTSGIQAQINALSGGVSGCLPLSGGTMTGDILANSGQNLGSSTKPFTVLYSNGVTSKVHDMGLSVDSGYKISTFVNNVQMTNQDNTAFYPNSTGLGLNLGKSSSYWGTVYGNVLDAISNVQVGGVNALTYVPINPGQNNTNSLIFGTSDATHYNSYLFASGDGSTSLLSITPGFKQNTATTGYCTYDIPGVSGTHYFWDKLETSNDITTTNVNVPNEGKFQSTGNVWINCGSGSIVKIGQNGASRVQIDTAMYPYTSGMNLGYSGTNYWGAVYASSYPGTSDERLKENIQPLTQGLDLVNQLQPKKFNYISDENKAVRYGLIAQDALPLLGDTGVIDQSNPDCYSINYMDLIAPLIKAVQELSAEVKELRAFVGKK